MQISNLPLPLLWELMQTVDHRVSIQSWICKGAKNPCCTSCFHLQRRWWAHHLRNMATTRRTVNNTVFNYLRRKVYCWICCCCRIQIVPFTPFKKFHPPQIYNWIHKCSTSAWNKFKLWISNRSPTTHFAILRRKYIKLTHSKGVHVITKKSLQSLVEKWRVRVQR
jgi:hypothetical protein